MIVFELSCDYGHRFEGWFGSSSDFADQMDRGLVTCPECGSSEVIKAPMAPAVPAKGNRSDNIARTTSGDEAQPVANRPMPEEVQKALATLAKAQEKALKNSTWVGEKFAEESRAMHYGETDEKPIHGQASLEEAESLIDEGIAVAPLPFPVAGPDKLN
jgi:hypothetical protein